MATNWPNDEQSLRRFLQPKILIIVETILENIKQTNVKKIDRIVYGAGHPTMYHRTGQFADLAWDTEIIKNTLYETEGEFKYAPDEMTDTHDSVITGEDMREYLAEIIYNGVAGHIFGEGFWTEKRDAWSALLEVVGSDNMNKWIKQGATKAGLTISFN